MSSRVFDRKFGPTFATDCPTCAGIYLFRDAAGRVIYVGKAANLRRRLQRYRLATRRRAHRKMRTLVREASALEVRALASERDALLEENALIRQLKPRYNVDGAFAFLYPSIGVGRDDGHLLLCFTTMPDAYAALGLRWFGAFRSRPRAKEAFEALEELLAFVGHVSRRSQLPAHPSRRGSRLVGLRRLPDDLIARIDPFLRGDDRALLAELSMALLSKPAARRAAARVEDGLRVLARFYDADARPLRSALDRDGRGGTSVPQDERDALFISTRDATR